MDLKPEKDLVAGTGKVEQAQKTFFFEREDGTIIHCGATEAWTIWSGRNQVLGRRPERFKLVGTSDGRTFQKAVEEAQKLMRTVGLTEAQERIRKGEQEELAIARTHIEAPINCDEMDRGGRPTRISALR